MKALHLTQFCSEGSVADSISFGDVPVPTTSPVKREVLVAVKASAINVDDIALCQDTAMGGWITHRRTPTVAHPLVGGCEYAGVVLAVGPDVKQLTAGDRVCGVQNPLNNSLPGTWAEQTLALEGDIVPIPAECDISFVEAAASGMSALVAGDMYKRAHLPAEGCRCLVIGASGGLGTVLLQLLRGHTGGRVHIAAVCSGTNAEMVKRLGADEAIDYRIGPFADQLATQGKFDVAFDFVGGSESERGAARVLRRGGQFITACGPMAGIGDRKLTCCEFSGWMCGVMGRLMKSMCCCCCARVTYEFAGGMPPLKARDFNAVVIEAGIRPEIALEVPFTEAPLRAALARVASRHTKGKVVMNMEHAGAGTHLGEEEVGVGGEGAVGKGGEAMGTEVGCWAAKPNASHQSPKSRKVGGALDSHCTT